MKEIGVVSGKLPHGKCLANIFAKIRPRENNHVYIIFQGQVHSSHITSNI